MEAPISPEELATALASACLDKKALEVQILDMRGLVDYTDIFILCNGSNRRQVRAIAEEVRRVGKHEIERPPRAVEGLPAARWVCVDFGDVVVHIFDGPLRGFYDLDGLWQDAPRLPVPESDASSEQFELR